MLSLGSPLVMGIVNATPDSFYEGSRRLTAEGIARRAREMCDEGAAIIDVGACSTRPDSSPCSEEEEIGRLRVALPAVRRAVPEAVVSVDTFRASVARVAVEELGADMVNDVSEASDPEMMRMVARLGVPYVLTSVEGELEPMLIRWAREVQQLRDYGQRDILLDPGFGFGTTREQDWLLLSQLDRMLVMGLPVVVGLSRKRMIREAAATDVEGALAGTVAAETIALMKGAAVLRAHDVRAAADACKIKMGLFDRMNMINIKRKSVLTPHFLTG